MKPLPISIHFQLADLFTKPLPHPRPRFSYLAHSLALCDLYPPARDCGGDDEFDEENVIAKVHNLKNEEVKNEGKQAKLGTGVLV